jgi:hypothetical protein
MGRIGIGIIATGFVLMASPALADRPPTKAETQKIRTALTAAGYKSWDKVEYDSDGARWHVIQARNMAGKVYNLELNPTDYRIYEKPMDYAVAGH